MTYTLLAFALFWGIWLLVPIIIDGSTALAYLIGVWFSPTRSGRKKAPELTHYPLVSIIIPVHNGARSVGKCIESLGRQSYPSHRIEVVVVDNLSDDQTFDEFSAEQGNGFEGSINWVSIPYKGKAGALNAGIHMTHGLYVFNIDCDVILHPDALLHMVSAFEEDPTLAAATGAIEVLPLKKEDATPFKRMVSECEFLEYYAGFRIGRQYQTVTNCLFTLAGAFSAFRREVLLQTFQYCDRTVSEDTDLTFEVHERFPHMRVACIARSIAYVEPTPSLSALYSQRVRWQRGQLEVVASHPKMLTKNLLKLKGLSPPKSLIIDHTLAFPRVVWTFFLPSLFLLGYPLPLVMSATIAMYLCYMAIEALFIGTSYILAENGTKVRIRKNWWLFAVMPTYRFVLFWFRFGGFLSAMAEPPQWKAQPPWSQSKIAGLRMANGAILLLSSGLASATQTLRAVATVNFGLLNPLTLRSLSGGARMIQRMAHAMILWITFHKIG